MESQKSDLAARVSWLYFVANQTQMEIAAALKVSRPTVQRLIASATRTGMVQVRLNHPTAHCMELAESLRSRGNLEVCEVAYAETPTQEQARRTVAIAAATLLEMALASLPDPILAIGSGRTMRAVVHEVAEHDLPRSSILSPVGVIARDGTFNRYDCGLRMADKTGGTCTVLPTELVLADPAERDRWRDSTQYALALDLQRRATAVFAGIGKLDKGSPLIDDGFLTQSEVRQLRRDGAAGEMLGWPLDRDGRLIEGWFTERVASLPLPEVAAKRLIACACGRDKLSAILAAVRGGWLTGLVTDMDTAALVLSNL